MKRHKVLALMLTIIMCASLIFTGCSKQTKTTPEQTAPAQTENNKQADKIDADQTLRVVGYEPKTFDPSATNDSNSFTTFTNVYEGLGREAMVDGKDMIVLAGAEKMDVSKDGLVYTFALRNGAKWSDGKPVTAKDYEFSWKRLINPESPYLYQNFIDFVKGVSEYRYNKGKLEDVGIKALDDKTFQVTLDHPVAYFSSMIAFNCLVPQREDVVKSLGKDYGQSWQKMVYNGPFVVSEFASNSKIVYAKNPEYWDAKNVKITKAECPIITEPKTLVQMFEAKQLDQTGATGDYIKSLNDKKDAGGYGHITGTDGSSFYLMFNFKNEVLKNVKIRKALAAAFDKQAYIDIVYKRNVTAYSFVAPLIAVGDKEYRKEAPEQAKKINDEVKDPKALFVEGLKELKKDTDPSKVKLLLLMGPASSTTNASAEFIQNEFQSKIGCKIEIKYSVDQKSYFADRDDAKYDLCFGGWGSDYNDVSSFFAIYTTEDGNNTPKYSNKEYDELVKKAAAEQDNAKRLELYKQAEEILVVKDPAFITSYYRDFQTFRYKYLKGFFQTLFSGYYSIKDAYIQGRQ